MLPLGFACFLCFGAVLVLVGANQAELARDLDLTLSRSGLLGSALALGIGLGVVAGGALFDRAARRPLFAGAALLASGALIGVDASMGFARAFGHVWLTGVGIGAYSMVINGSVAERFGAGAARPMAAVHAAATLGAVLGAPLVGWVAVHHHWTASFQGLGAAHLMLAGGALATRLPERRPHAAGPASDGDAPGLSPALLPLALVAFAYIGVESTLTIFAVPYAAGALELGEERGRLAISAFWLGLLAGRLAVLAPSGNLDERVLRACGLLGSGVLAVGITSGTPRVEWLFGACGVSLGCVYPVLIALTGQRFAGARGTAQGLAAGAGALGGFGVPWLTGALGDRLGIAAALLGLAAWSLAIALAATAARRFRA